MSYLLLEAWPLSERPLDTVKVASVETDRRGAGDLSLLSPAEPCLLLVPGVCFLPVDLPRPSWASLVGGPSVLHSRFSSRQEASFIG